MVSSRGACVAFAPGEQMCSCGRLSSLLLVRGGRWTVNLVTFAVVAGCCPLGRLAHSVGMLWGPGGASGTVPREKNDPYLFVCLFPRATEPGREYRPHRKKKEQEIVQKGVMK